MLVQAPAHERTVHPELARAVVLGLRRHPSTRTVRTVHTQLDLGRPIPESLHRRLLTELAGHGWPAIAAAAAHLLDPRRDPDFAAVLERGDLAELADRLPALQLRFHAGHATRLRLLPEAIEVRHGRLLGTTPHPAESLFVAAIHQALIGACLGRTPEVTIRYAHASRIDGWRLNLAPGRPRSVSWSAAVRQTIRTDPAHRWRLDTVAARWAMSSRTLQRLLAQEHTGFRRLLTDTRLDLAHGLILRTDIGLGDVAAACGFTDHAHLTRSFTTHHGFTPSALRTPITI